MAHPLTPEQSAVVDTVRSGGDVVVEALAGTGKTSTAVAVAAAQPSKTHLLVSFNRAIVDEAQARFGSNTTARTAHGLAFRAVGEPFTSRSRGPRMKSSEIAKHVGLTGFDVATGYGRRRIAPGFLAGLLLRSMRSFSISADLAPTKRHIPVPRTAREDPVLLDLYKEIAHHLEPFLAAAWADISSPDGSLPVTPNDLLKMWHLRGPVLPYDVIMFDEAQDANEVMRAIVSAQPCQHLWVGDTFQQINEWNGAVNALARVDVDHRLHLTHSFRFGPEIAEVANVPLSDLGSEFPIVGAGAPSRLGTLDAPDVTLTRTNAVAVKTALDLIDDGFRPHIMGGAGDVVEFCRGVNDLRNGRSSTHPDLVCFDSWADVLAYVANDELGGDLATVVDLIRDHGVDKILATLENQPDEDHADRVVSTTHKVKGREWPRVHLANDFRPSAIDVEELRLIYVAITRAQEVLDPFAVGYLTDGLFAPIVAGR